MTCAETPLAICHCSSTESPAPLPARTDSIYLTSWASSVRLSRRRAWVSASSARNRSISGRAASTLREAFSRAADRVGAIASPCGTALLPLRDDDGASRPSAVRDPAGFADTEACGCGRLGACRSLNGRGSDALALRGDVTVMTWSVGEYDRLPAKLPLRFANSNRVASDKLDEGLRGPISISSGK